MTQDHPTRRDVLKDAVYMTPAILTLAAVPAFASSGSGRDREKDDRDQDQDKDKQNKNKQKHK